MRQCWRRSSIGIWWSCCQPRQCTTSSRITRLGLPSSLAASQRGGKLIPYQSGYTVYIAAIPQKHPSQMTKLFAYQLTIIKAAQQYDGLQWCAYDTHFRVCAAATGNKSWSKLDTDLYTRFSTGRAKACSTGDSTQHSSLHCLLGVRKRACS